MTFVNCKVYRWRIQDSSRSCCLLLAPFTLWHCVQHVAHRAQHATWQHLNYFYYVLENEMSSRTRCIHSYSERKTIWLGGSPAGTTGHVNVNPVKCATTSCFFLCFFLKSPFFVEWQILCMPSTCKNVRATKQDEIYKDPVESKRKKMNPELKLLV